MRLNKDLSSAKNYALRLIKFRARSEKEFRDKLKNKEYSAEVIEEVIGSLKKARLLDDRLFAKLWVESRIKRPLGLARLRYELKQKGIDKDIIESTLCAVMENYDEGKIIGEIMRSKIKKMGSTRPDKFKSRLYGFLIRRGYPRHLVVEALLQHFVSDENQDVML